jgi:hypothetical protein
LPAADPTTPAAIMARQFLGPEAFPLYYNAANPFLLNNQRSGAVNARARLSFELNNWPHVAFGLRITNVYPLPEGADDQLFDVQEISFVLAQQNVIADPIHQATLTGGQNGIHWHPFPKPYLFRGANQARMDVVRLTAYPQLGQEDILPVCRATLVTAVLVNDELGRTRAAPGSTNRP